MPVPIRFLLAFDAALSRAVLRVFLRTVFGWLRLVGGLGASAPRRGRDIRGPADS